MATSPEILRSIVDECKFPKEAVEGVCGLFDRGLPLPFVLLHRKDECQGMDERRLRRIHELWREAQTLEARKKKILEALEETGRASENRERAVRACTSLRELDDATAHLRKTADPLADEARAAGLQDLAEALWEQAKDGPPVAELLREHGPADMAGERVLDCALALVAERVAEDGTLRRRVREALEGTSRLEVQAGESASKPSDRFAPLIGRKESVRALKDELWFDLLAGERCGVLKLLFTWKDEDLLSAVRSRIINKDSPYEKELARACESAYRRWLRPQAERSLRLSKREAGDLRVLDGARRSLETVLMTPAAGARTVLSILPGHGEGCRVAVVGRNGKLRDTALVHPLKPQLKTRNAAATLGGLVRKHHVEIVVVGDGGGGRDLERLLRQWCRDGHWQVEVTMLPQAAADAHAAKDEGEGAADEVKKEFRGAASLARAVQEPLDEFLRAPLRVLCNRPDLEDVHPRRLERGLREAAQNVVARLGVELSTASTSLLAHVPGLNDEAAEAIVAERGRRKGFENLRDIAELPKISRRMFAIAAGFLRLKRSGNPLDETRIHPESYIVAQKVAASRGCSLDELMGKKIDIDAKTLVDERHGLETVRFVLKELERSMGDPRGPFRAVTFDPKKRVLGDLKVGDEVEGMVTNVCEFGAFVNCGVDVDGLVHVSALQEGFVGHPAEVVRPGQVLKCRILAVDAKRKRLSLAPASAAPIRGRGEGPGAPRGRGRGTPGKAGGRDRGAPGKAGGRDRAPGGRKPRGDGPPPRGRSPRT